MLHRLVQAGFLNFDSSPTGMPEEVQLRRFKELVASVAKEHRIVIFLYPTLKNLQNKSTWLEVISPIKSLRRIAKAKRVDIAQDSAWNARSYTSDGVHPTVEGNKILASIVANAMK
ncbi:MAG: hypothetical protein WBG11_12165 [Methylocella sp.]